MSQSLRLKREKKINFFTIKINDLKNIARDIINGLENVNDIIENEVGSEDSGIYSIDDLIQIFNTINLELKKLNKKNISQTANKLMKIHKSINIILEKYNDILEISLNLDNEVNSQKKLSPGVIYLILGTFDQVKENINTFFIKIKDLRNDYIEEYQIRNPGKNKININPLEFRSLIDLIESKSKKTFKTKKAKSLSKSKSKSKNISRRETKYNKSI